MKNVRASPLMLVFLILTDITVHELNRVIFRHVELLSVTTRTTELSDQELLVTTKIFIGNYFGATGVSERLLTNLYNVAIGEANELLASKMHMIFTQQLEFCSKLWIIC